MEKNGNDYICSPREGWGDVRELFVWQLELKEQGRHWYFLPSRKKQGTIYIYIHTQEIRYILLYSICKILFHKRPMETSMTKYSCASSLQKMGHLYIYYFSLCALRLSCPISDLSYWVLFVCFMYTAVMLASKITAVSFLFQVTH